MPIVTGQDAEVPSVKSIIAGEQYSTMFKDTRDLAKVAADMVDAVLSGGKPEVNDTKTYNNGVKVVPSYLLKPVSGRHDQLEEGAGRHRLLQGRPAEVSQVHRSRVSRHRRRRLFRRGGGVRDRISDRQSVRQRTAEPA